MKTIKIFVASSDELAEERRALADMVGHLNFSLNKVGMNILLVKWEYLDASMGPLHKQEEYNQELKDCEICMVLYWTKFGMYTKAELDTAYTELKAGHNPRKLYVYFKDGERPLSPELKEFKDCFPNLYGHFYCVFRNEDALKSHFLLQLIDYQNSRQMDSMSGIVEVQNSKVLVAGNEFIDLNNVDFVGKNDEYRQLLQLIRKTKQLLAVTEATDSDYSKYTLELLNLTEKRQKMEENLWQTALTITRLSNEASSERLQLAIELFNKGDNRGANAILDEVAIYRDIDRNLRNIELGKVGLKNNIAELRLKLDVLRNQLSEGWREQSVDIHKKIITLTEQVYGVYSQEYPLALSNAAFLYAELGRYEEALQYYEKSAAIQSDILGEEHLATATSYNNIGSLYDNLGDYSKALEYSEKALKIQIKKLGEVHPDIAISYNNIGLLYCKLGEYANGLEYCGKSLKMQLKIYGDEHPDVATSYNSIGFIYGTIGDYSQALKHYRKALEIRLRIFGESHPDIATSYNNIGFVYDATGDYSQALRHYRKALDIRLRMFGEAHPDVATGYNNMGLVYDHLGDNATALGYYGKALGIRLKIFGAVHPDVATSYNNIGSIYDNMAEYSKAMEL